MRINTLFLLFTIISCGSLFAQNNYKLKSILLVNGGQFGNSAEPAHLVSITPDSLNVIRYDSMLVNSVQDVEIKNTTAFIAAQDSIFAYDLVNGSRLASTNFPKTSTVKLFLTDSILVVGNYFGSNGSANVFLYDFNLNIIDSIPQAVWPAYDFALFNDSLYITQNEPSSSFTDSAGHLLIYDLNTMQFVRRDTLSSNNEDIGRIVNINDTLYFLNGVSNTLTKYAPATRFRSTSALADNISPYSYRVEPSLTTSPEITTGKIEPKVYIPANGAIALFNLETGLVEQDSIIDSTFTALQFDPLEKKFYVTNTDFFSFTRGHIFDSVGNFISNLPGIGFSPEALDLAYNFVPEGSDTSIVSALTVSIDLNLLFTDFESDEQLTYSINQNTINFATALSGDTLAITPGPFFSGIDSLIIQSVDAWGDTAFATIVINTNTSATKQNLYSHINIYPNPTQDFFTIDHKNNDAHSISIHDVNGKTIFDIEASVSGQPIDIRHLSSGSYFIRVTSKDKIYQSRLIKK